MPKFNWKDYNLLSFAEKHFQFGTFTDGNIVVVSQSSFMKTFFVRHLAHLLHLDLVPVPVEVGAGETLEDFAHICVRLHLVVGRMRNCVEDDGEGD